MPEDPLDLEDKVEIATSETEGMVDKSQSTPLEPEVSSGQSTFGAPEPDYLEETPLPTTAENHDLQAGSTVDWGGFGFTVDGPYSAGWYAAHKGDQKLLVKPQMDGGLLVGLGNHRMLPKVLYSGPEGVAVAADEGQPIGAKPSLEKALEITQPLAQLVYFLELKGLTLLDIERKSLILGDAGVHLLPPPRLARIGEVAPPFWRDGHTPPELLAEAPVSAKTGVYAVGALLFELLNGAPLPVEGASDLLLSGLAQPGVPQVLAQMLAPLKQRTPPQQAIALLKSLEKTDPVMLEVVAATSIGLNPTRIYNEDSYGYRLEHLQSQGLKTLWLRACVSDGMGGMAAGELASQAAVETFLAGVAPYPLDDPQAQADWAVRLVWDSNQAVLEALAGKDGGCTLSGLVFVGARYVLGHVGDTRAYLWSKAELKQISQDHSLVAAMVASGMITEEEAQTHPDRNKVLRSLGNLRQPQADYVQTLSVTLGSPSAVLEPGAMLLLMSDGVWGEVSNAGIKAILSRLQDPHAIAQALVDAAIEAGAPDNATALVVQRKS